ncbi:MAG: hypothetical protein RIC55_18865 [Pirellulaceae bacterium]
MEQRRARQRGSALKTVLLLLFAFMAIAASGAVVVFLWGYSTVEDVRQSSQEQYDQARSVATQQLRSMQVALQAGAEVEFYDDGCIVRGTGRTKTQRRVPCEVSIAITETETKSRWIVDYVVVDGKTVYAQEF